MKIQMIDHSIELTELLSRKIQRELENNDQRLNQITKTLLNTGNYMLNNKVQITNDYLSEIGTAYDIDHIYYYESTGELVSSSDDTYIGWTPTDGDPINIFMESGHTNLVEDVRKGTDTDDFYRFVYIRGEDGDFIQLGHRLETIEHLIPSQIIQSTLERVIDDDDYLVYSFVTNEDMVTIAGTDPLHIGKKHIDEKAYHEAFNGMTISTDGYYNEIDKSVIEVITPLKINDEIFGIVVIGITQNVLKGNALFLAGIILLITSLISLNYYWIQRKNVIKPISQLCNDINDIDPEVPLNQFTYNKKSILFGLYESIENLLLRLHSSNQKIKVLNDEISELAYKDYLTKLPNRFTFKKEFNKLIHFHDKIAMILLDLNNFKDYNDTRGHTIGDELLLIFGQRLNEISNSSLLVSRYGGDEFMLAAGFDEQEMLLSTIKRIEESFNEPIIRNGELYFLEASIGISIYPEDSNNLDELMTFSDLAMYTIKVTGDTGVAFYNDHMKKERFRSVEIKRLLKEAIEKDEFIMLYQPIIDVASHTVDNYEALIRFKDHDIYPDEFIPIAESTGLIIPIGRFVIESAIKQISKMKLENHVCTRISVNFSTKQFYDESIIEFIEEKLQLYDVSGDCLIIEITETFLHEKSIEEISRFLGELRKLQIKVAIDDFGTGFTSVMFFNQFPFDTIKLDRSFVVKNLENASFTFESWISLFRAYNYKIVAEGVETREQFDQLKDLGIDYVQGYYFSKPVPSDELTLGNERL